MSLEDKIAKLEADIAAAKKELEKQEEKKDPKDVAKDAFNAIDTDGSGYIDENEFQQLSVVLGTPLSKDEIKDIISKLDKDADGRISFDEFLAWFEKDDNKDDKDASKLAAIKAKVQLHIAQKKTEEFFKALKDAADKEKKQLVENKEQDDFNQFRVCFKSGTVKPDIKLSLGATFEQVEENVVTIALKTKDASEDEVKAFLEQDYIAVYTGMLGMFGAELEHELKDDLLVFTIALPMDPLAMATQMGLDLSKLLDTFKVDIQFGERNTGKFEIDIKVKKSLLQAVGKVPGIPRRIIGNLKPLMAVNKVDFEVNIGDVAASLGEDNLPNGVSEMLRGGAKQFVERMQGKAAPVIYEKLEEILDEEKASNIYSFLTNNIVTINTLQLASQSGIKITLKNNGLLDFTSFPTLNDLNRN